MSAATSIGKGLILLCFIVVVYISLAAYEMDNNVGQQLIQKKIVLASNSCANPATNTVESPGETNKPEQVVDLTVISRDFFLYLSSHLHDLSLIHI